MNTNRPFQVVPPDGGAKRKSVRILIADDDRDNANMLAAVLRDEQHETVVALRGDEALEICRLFRPDVGFDHYLIKPFEPKEILRLVETFQGMSSGNGTASA